MMESTCRWLLAAFLLGIGLSGGSFADMPTSAFSNGGARLEGTDFILHCTVGQGATDVVGPSPGGFICELGFLHAWFGYASDVPTDKDALPTDYQLMALRPMGATPRLRYAVPTASQVSIRLYDVTGRQALVLADGAHAPGFHEATVSTARLATGIYFCRMTAPGFSAMRRFVVVK